MSSNVTAPKTAEEVQDLLRDRAPDIRELQVENQRIKFDTEEWRRWFDATYFEADEAVAIFDNASDGFSRGELFDIARAAADNDYELPELRKLWLAVYAWGGGSGATGYRARVNARLAFFDNRFADSMRTMIERLTANDLVGAHQAIDPVIGAGEGFFTKFLYFVSKPGVCEPLPLIYDEQVRRALQALLGPRWALPLGATMSDSVAEIYDRYVRTMHGWAEQLNCSPDQLELFLFQSRGRIIE